MKTTLIVFTLTVLQSCKQELKVDTITPDNIYQHLKVNEQGIPYAYFGVYDFQPWSPHMDEPEMMSSSPYMEVETIMGNHNNKMLKLKQTTSQTEFTLRFQDDKVFQIIVSNLELGISDAEECVKHLLTEHGYVYKKTNLKQGSDMLIKKYEEKFIIVKILRREQGDIFSMIFHVYSPK
jgi:hypothetical protein